MTSQSLASCRRVKATVLFFLLGLLNPDSAIGQASKAPPTAKYNFNLESVTCLFVDTKVWSLKIAVNSGYSEEGLLGCEQKVLVLEIPARDTDILEIEATKLGLPTTLFSSATPRVLKGLSLPIRQLLSQSGKSEVALRAEASSSEIRLIFNLFPKPAADTHPAPGGSIGGRPWTDGNGKVRPHDELVLIVQTHEKWLEEHRNDYSDYGFPIKHQVPELRGADLRGQLTARLPVASFDDSKITVVGERAKPLNLGRLVLTGADLSRSDLSSVILENSDLRGTNLNGTALGEAKVAGAIFEPTQLPATIDIATAEGLDRLTWWTDPRPLFSLRKSLRDDGFNDAARKITAAIHRHEQGWGERLAFDWTCEWGANALRPIQLAVGFSIVCSLIYWGAMYFPTRQSGLFIVATGQRISTAKGKERTRRLGVRPRPSFRTAILFSLMSTCNIGFKEFNFGRWIRLLQPREYDIRARGWLRTLSGLQALVGLALLALSILSYFGHPFD